MTLGLFLDTETTGIGPKAHIAEVAVVVIENANDPDSKTLYEANVIFPTIIGWWNEDVAMRMHKENGLFDESLKVARQYNIPGNAFGTVDFLSREFWPITSKLIELSSEHNKNLEIIGDSPHFDRNVLRHTLVQRLEEWNVLSHRQIDVSSICRVMGIEKTPEERTHRATHCLKLCRENYRAIANARMRLMVQ